ncbi:hypothetical protein [Nonomuraea sp. NEAU-A123]|uniref:hypothetical protein n=1 Tax=Nonomuraea sp. NEAU-A123 TaxID=2839649 RepID=UPI001BE423A2|nr:hypothetical protein [Nonomuraea sp. NEAU-A123]MBT2229252.1 hypothetical protein [Nonomuraea sp. NEAU-A123]
MRLAAPRQLMVLLGGRAAFRGTLLLANVVLLAVWSSGDYAGYAQAMGGAAFLTPLASIGIEKCALKLIPRARHTVGLLVGVFVALAGLLLAVAVAVLAGVLLFGHNGPWALAGLAGLYAISVGGNQVLVGLSRAIGKPGRDVANHLILATGLACSTGAAATGHASPVVFLALWLTTVSVLNVALLAGLRPSFAGLRRRVLVRVAVGTSLLMAIPDVVAGVSMSLLFVTLSVAGAQAESTGLYMASIASGTLLNAFGYLLRVLQPGVSQALNQRDLTAAYDRLSRWLRLLLLAGTPYVAAVSCLAPLLLRPLGGLGVVILYVACVPVIFAVGSASYVMENATPLALRATAVGAVVSLLAVVALAAIVVPWAGALGAVGVLATGALVHAAVLLRWLRPRRTLSPHPVAKESLS